MSREEAKQIISDIDKAYRNFTADEYKALEMAIKALSHEPTAEKSVQDMTELEKALLHIKTRADAWAVKVVKDALSQEPCDKCVYSTKDGYCQYDDVTETIPPLEPCTDAVSREEVKKIVDFYSEQYDGIFRVNESIDKLPSVNPQPCDDAISRDAVLKIIDKWYENKSDIEDLIILITYMSSVTQKSGKWITGINWKCNNCGYVDFGAHGYNFCPNCGARMESEE